jgi:hypothetical protein
MIHGSVPVMILWSDGMQRTQSVSHVILRPKAHRFTRQGPTPCQQWFLGLPKCNHSDAA